MTFYYSFVYISGLLSIAAAIEPVDVKVTVNKSTGNFQISLQGQEWLRSGAVGVRNGGQWWKSNNKDHYLLKPTNPLTLSGQDAFGEFDTTSGVFELKMFSDSFKLAPPLLLCSLSWDAYSDNDTPANFTIETSVSVYRNEPIVAFAVVYISGLTNASIPDTPAQAVSTFPSFVVEEGGLERGYFTWAGNSKSVI